MKSFRKLLVKKTAEGSDLRKLVKGIFDEVLEHYVVERLEKYEPHGNAVDSAVTPAVSHFKAQHLNDNTVDTIRHAMAHHVSEYKAARQAMHDPEQAQHKTALRDIADKHLSVMVPMMHLVMKASNKDGPLWTKHASIRPWEMNVTSPETRGERDDKSPNKPHRGTKGWRIRANPKSSSPYTPKDYRFLEQPAHPAHHKFSKDPQLQGHENHAYPWEEIQIGHKSAVDQNKAHLPIDNRKLSVDANGAPKYVPHIFDSHPVMEDIIPDAASHSYGEHSPKAIDIRQRMDDWHSSPEFFDFLDHPEVSPKIARDENGHHVGGHIKPEHVHSGLPTAEAPAHNVNARIVSEQRYSPIDYSKSGANMPAGSKPPKKDIKKDPLIMRTLAPLQEQQRQYVQEKLKDPKIQRQIDLALGRQKPAAAPVQAAPASKPAAVEKPSVPQAEEYDLSKMPEGAMIEPDTYHALPDSVKSMLHESHGSKPKPKSEPDFSKPPKGSNYSQKNWDELPPKIKEIIYRSHGGG